MQIYEVGIAEGYLEILMYENEIDGWCPRVGTLKGLIFTALYGTDG